MSKEISNASSKAVSKLVLFAILLLGSGKAFSSSNFSLYDLYQKTREKVTGQSLRFDQALLSSYQIVLVPGIWTQSYIYWPDLLRSAGIPIPQHTLKAFGDVLSSLQEMGVDAILAPIDTAQNCQVNGDALAQYILQSPKKIILITHSKGGIDALSALLNYPSLMKNLAGWISLQAPFFGSPVIDWLLDLSLRQPLGQGQLQALECLASEERQREFQLHQADIKDHLSQTPFLSVASWKRPNLPWSIVKGELGLFDSLLHWMAKPPYSTQSDGLVPTPSSCLFPESCLVLENMDHAGPVMDIPHFASLGKDNRFLLIRTLLNMVLQRH